MTDTMREKFEKIYCRYDLTPHERGDEGYYKDIETMNAWFSFQCGYQAAQADARALVGEYLDFMKKYRVCLIAENGDLDEKAKSVSVLDERIAKAQAFMEGK